MRATEIGPRPLTILWGVGDPKGDRIANTHAVDNEALTMRVQTLESENRNLQQLLDSLKVDREGLRTESESLVSLAATSSSGSPGHRTWSSNCN